MTSPSASEMGDRPSQATLNALLFAVVLLWIAFAVPVSLYDLAISKSIADPTASLGILIERLGGIPGQCVIVLAALLMSSQRLFRARTLNAVSAGLLGLLSAFLLYDIGMSIAAFASPSWEHSFKARILILMLAAAATAVLLAIVWSKGRAWANAHAGFAKTTLALALLSYVIFAQGLKGIWGRVRFRDLAPDFSDFTPWFVPRGFTGHFSFPSGHAVLGWMLLALLLFGPRRPKPLRAALLILIVGWAGLVAYARVLAGAHFASDVLFSTGFTASCFLLLWKHKEKIHAS